MTEEEAKTKWCPFTRVLGVTKGGVQSRVFNRVVFGDGKAPDLTPQETYCIGSACMAWRTKEQHDASMADGAAPKGEGWVKSPLDSGRLQNWSREINYCGLAGAP